MEIVLIGVIAALCCVCIVLYDRSVDLRWRLTSAESDARRWKDEAVKRGWKNPFQEVIDSLKESTDKLEAAAARMKQTAGIQRQNAEKLKAINANLQKANEALKVQSGHLDRVAARFKPKPSVIEASSGPIETDRSKLN